MRNEPLVTIVIPIYNTERYVARCVDSVLGQTYPHLEVILVDDGSPDDCPRICDAYAAKDSRVVVIHKQNAGLGMARNSGIDAATGDYICFIDSDDYIAADTVSSCVAAAVEQQADMVIFGHHDVTTDGTVLQSHIPHPPKRLYEGAEIVADLLPAALYTGQSVDKDWGLPLCAWNKMIALPVVRASGWRFVSEREVIAEDYYSLTALHGYLNRVYAMDRPFYHYMVNTGSLTHAFRADRFDGIKAFYGAMISLTQRMGLNGLLNPVQGIALGLTIGAMKQVVSAAMPFGRRYTALRNMLRDAQLQEWVRTADLSAVGMQKRLLYTAVKHRWVPLCYLFLYLKNKRDTR